MTGQGKSYFPCSTDLYWHSYRVMLSQFFPVWLASNYSRIDNHTGEYPVCYMYVMTILEFLKYIHAGRPGSSEVHRHPLTRWDVSSIPANGIFLTKKTKK